MSSEHSWKVPEPSEPLPDHVDEVLSLLVRRRHIPVCDDHWGNTRSGNAPTTGYRQINRIRTPPQRVFGRKIRAYCLASIAQSEKARGFMRCEARP